jgi:hypothetical protein
MLFSLVLTLCQRFPALSPFAVYRERFHDVLILFEDLKQNLKSAKGTAKTMVIDGQVYTEAQNDDWY